MIRLHVFQHVAHEDLGSLEAVFAARGAEISWTRFFAGESPPGPEVYDFLVVLGGPMNVYEEDKHPWLAAEKDALRAALAAGRPVLGLCLGAQLMAVALGGAVTRNPEREIGWGAVEVLPEAASHPVASCFPARFETYHWHGDTFAVPEGATPLFRSAGCANQGFAWGERAVALQFHPEITAEAVTRWIDVARADGGGDLAPGPYVQSPEAMSADAARGDRVADNNRWMAALCGLLMDRA